MKTSANRRATLLSVIYLMTCLFLLGIDIARADNEIQSGTTLKVDPGTTVIGYGDAVLTGGSINNQGTMIIKGNLVNQNSTSTDLGTGTFEFAGTAAQTISGPNVFTNLKINNTAGVSLTGTYDGQVNGALTLSNGLLTLGSLNLLMGSSATVAGTPSVSAMVVADGSGELRKSFSGLTSFTFPVGDADGTAEYSPVTANFTAGTFGTGNFLGVNLKNLRDPSLNTVNYLKRYWTLNNNGITNLSCQLTFNFTDADVNGVKDDLYCLKTLPVFETYNKYASGNQLTGTVTSFSRFTGANVIDITPNITAEPSVMHGITAFNIITQVTELNFGSTNGLITVLIPKESRWSFTYDSGATMIGSTPVNNSNWSYSSTDPVYHTFTSSAVISKGGFSRFGFNAVFDAGATLGTYSMTSQITSWSGGENRIDNNADAEKLDYFIN